MHLNEESESFLDGFDAALAKEQARQGKFIETLQNALIDVSIQHFPKTKPYKHLFIETLTVTAHRCAVYINETLDLVLGGYTGDSNELYNESHVPSRDVAEDERQFFEDTLRPMPPEQHAYFIELNTERVNNDARVREYVFLCYDKAKEVIVQFFPEIFDFSGNSLRRIDLTAYQRVDEWTYEFYYYAGDYMNI